MFNCKVLSNNIWQNFFDKSQVIFFLIYTSTILKQHAVIELVYFNQVSEVAYGSIRRCLKSRPQTMYYITGKQLQQMIFHSCKKRLNYTIDESMKNTFLCWNWNCFPPGDIEVLQNWENEKESLYSILVKYGVYLERKQTHWYNM